MPAQEAVLARTRRERPRYLAELIELLRIPSISTDPQYQGDVARCAEHLRARLAEAGLAAELIPAESVGVPGGHPLIYAEWLGAPGKPTVLFYGHYDVQPPDPLAEWRSPPFEPRIEGDVLYARGATDDKGQCYTHVKAVEALLAETGRLPVNVKFLIEGEEEGGGKTIDTFVARDRGRRLACDCVVVSDTAMLDAQTPTLLYGLRGLVYTEVTVEGPSHDLHSGLFGGAVRNPINALAQILAGLHDPATGRVTVPGFYDDVRALAEWERQAFARLPFDEGAYCRELGIPGVAGETGWSTRERVWARPTCDANGIFGGYQGAGAKTILPARAGAKVSMRLVPDQDPERIAASFTEHVQRLAPSGVRVKVHIHSAGRPILIEPSGPLVDAARAAITEVWGKAPVPIREGGSIPIVASFASVLRVPILLLGFGLPDDRLHSPNEKFNLSQFYRGIDAIATLLLRLGAA